MSFRFQTRHAHACGTWSCWSGPRSDKTLQPGCGPLADLVDSDGLACEPIAATVILSGNAGDEVLHMRYGAEHRYFNDAAAAMAKVASPPPEKRAGDSHPQRTTI